MNTDGGSFSPLPPLPKLMVMLVGAVPPPLPEDTTKLVRKEAVGAVAPVGVYVVSRL